MTMERDMTVKNTIVQGETLPEYGLVVNSIKFETRAFNTLEEAECARDARQCKRLDQKIEIYQAHGKILQHLGKL
jgi:hypothetical protein